MGRTYPARLHQPKRLDWKRAFLRDLALVYQLTAQGDDLLADLGGPAFGFADALLKVRQPGDGGRVTVVRGDLLRQLVDLAVPLLQFPLEAVPLGFQFRHAGAPRDAELGDGLAQHGRVLANALDLLDDEPLDLARGDRLRRASMPAAL
jgi:hypothetical protein